MTSLIGYRVSASIRKTPPPGKLPPIKLPLGKFPPGIFPPMFLNIPNRVFIFFVVFFIIVTVINDIT